MDASKIVKSVNPPVAVNKHWPSDFKCPYCLVPYSDRREWSGDDVIKFDCMECGKEIVLKITEITTITYKVLNNK